MKTLNGQKVTGISPVGEEEACGGKDLPKSQVIGSEWKTTRMRDESGDSEDGEDDRLPRVIEGESEGNCTLTRNGEAHGVQWEVHYVDKSRKERLVLSLFTVLRF